MNCQACKDLKWILFILAWNHLVAVRFLSTVFTVSAQRVNIVAEVDEQPVQFMIRGDLKNVECIIPLIHHMYRSFLRVVHLKSLLIFGSRLKRCVPFSLGLITQTSIVNIPLFTGVYTSQVVIAGFLPSTVPQVATLQELYLFVQRCNFENSMGNVHLGKSVK